MIHRRECVDAPPPDGEHKTSGIGEPGKDAPSGTAQAPVDQGVPPDTALRHAPARGPVEAGTLSDPKVRFDPKNWKGPLCKGKPMSECPTEFLTLYSNCMAFFGQRNEREGKLDDAERDFAQAKAAEAWIALRQPPTTAEMHGDDEIPF